MRAPNHLNALRAFEATARHLSYVRAADELNVTPAAVGQLVRGLEDALEVALFHRASSGPARLELTGAARAVLADVQAGFDLLGGAVHRLRAGNSRSSLIVTVPPAFADKWLLRRLERFQGAHPGIDIVLETDGRLVNFDTDRVDVGIRFGGGRWQGVEATRLFGDDFFPVCSPQLLGGPHPLLCAADLRHHQLIHDTSMRFESSFPTWHGWLAKAGLRGLDVDRGLQINDSAAVLRAVIAGAGVALGRSSLVEDDLLAGKIVRPFGEAQRYDFAYYVVCRPGMGDRPEIAAFRAWLLEEAGR